MMITMAGPKQLQCRTCEEPFIWLPGKPGYIDECPVCLLAKSAQEATPKANRHQLEELLEYMVSHPLKVCLENGTEVILVRPTLIALEVKLKRRTLSPASIEKLLAAYEGSILAMKNPPTQL